MPNLDNIRLSYKSVLTLFNNAVVQLTQQISRDGGPIFSLYYLLNCVNLVGVQLQQLLNGILNMMKRQGGEHLSVQCSG